MYNKRKFNKINDKKVLHKVKKQWVTISIAMLGLLGYGAITTVKASANTDSQNNNQGNQQINNDQLHNYQHKLVNNNQIDYDNQNNSNINDQSPTISNIIKKSNQLHQNILTYNMNNIHKMRIGNDSNDKNRKPVIHKEINTTHSGNLVTINKKQAKATNNINHLKINNAKTYHKYVYKRIRVPFHTLRIKKNLLVHSSIDFNNSKIYKSLHHGTRINIRRAFKQFGHYNNYLRYEISLTNKHIAFITGNNHFVSYVIPTKNYKYYRNKTNRLVHKANYKNANKINKQLYKLNRQHNHSPRKYAHLYEMAFNAQQRAKHPVVVDYNAKQFKSNSSDNTKVNNDIQPVIQPVQNSMTSSFIPDIMPSASSLTYLSTKSNTVPTSSSASNSSSEFSISSMASISANTSSLLSNMNSRMASMTPITTSLAQQKPQLLNDYRVFKSYSNTASAYNTNYDTSNNLANSYFSNIDSEKALASSENNNYLSAKNSSNINSFGKLVLNDISAASNDANSAYSAASIATSNMDQEISNISFANNEYFDMQKNVSNVLKSSASSTSENNNYIHHNSRLGAVRSSRPLLKLGSTRGFNINYLDKNYLEKLYLNELKETNDVEAKIQQLKDQHYYHNEELYDTTFGSVPSSTSNSSNKQLITLTSTPLVPKQDNFVTNDLNFNNGKSLPVPITQPLYGNDNNLDSDFANSDGTGGINATLYPNGTFLMNGGIEHTGYFSPATMKIGWPNINDTQSNNNNYINNNNFYNGDNSDAPYSKYNQDVISENFSDVRVTGDMYAQFAEQPQMRFFRIKNSNFSDTSDYSDFFGNDNNLQSIQFENTKGILGGPNTDSDNWHLVDPSDWVDMTTGDTNTNDMTNGDVWVNKKNEPVYHIFSIPVEANIYNLNGSVTKRKEYASVKGLLGNSTIINLSQLNLPGYTNISNGNAAVAFNINNNQFYYTNNGDTHNWITNQTGIDPTLVVKFKSSNMSTKPVININYISGNHVIKSIKLTNQVGTSFNLDKYISNMPYGYLPPTILQGGNVNKFTPGNQSINIKLNIDPLIIKPYELEVSQAQSSIKNDLGATHPNGLNDFLNSLNANTSSYSTLTNSVASKTYSYTKSLSNSSSASFVSSVVSQLATNTNFINNNIQSLNNVDEQISNDKNLESSYADTTKSLDSLLNTSFGNIDNMNSLYSTATSIATSAEGNASNASNIATDIKKKYSMISHLVSNIKSKASNDSGLMEQINHILNSTKSLPNNSSKSHTQKTEDINELLANLNNQIRTLDGSVYTKPKSKDSYKWGTARVRYTGKDVMIVSDGTITANVPDLPYHKNRTDWTLDIEHNVTLGKTFRINNDNNFAHINLNTNMDANNISGAVHVNNDGNSISSNSNVNASHITNASGLFSSNPNLKDIDLGGINFNNASSIDGMFSNDTKLESVNLNNVKASKSQSNELMFASDPNLHNINLSNFVAGTSISNMFSRIKNIKDINFSNVDLSNVRSANGVFSSDKKLSDVQMNNNNLSKATTLSGMFANDPALHQVNLSYVNASKSSDNSDMFKGDNNTNIQIDLDGFKAGHTISHMFAQFPGLRSLSQTTWGDMDLDKTSDLSGLFSSDVNLINSSDKNPGYPNTIVPENPLDGSTISPRSNFNSHIRGDISYMFANDKKLKRVELEHVGDYFHNVTNASHMFSHDQNLHSVNLNSVDFGNAKYINNIFSDDPALENVYLQNVNASKAGTIRYGTTPRMSGVNGSDGLNGSSDLFKDDKDLQNVYLSNFHASPNINGMFSNIPNLGKDGRNLKVFHWTGQYGQNGMDLSKTKYANNLFANDQGLYRVSVSDLHGLDLSHIGGANDIPKPNDDETFGTASLFANDKDLSDVDLHGLNLSNNSNISNMFANDKSLKNVNLQDVDAHNVGCAKLGAPLAMYFPKIFVSGTANLFQGDKNLQNVYLSNFHAGPNIGGMFSNIPDLGKNRKGLKTFHWVDSNGQHKIDLSNTKCANNLFTNDSGLYDISISDLHGLDLSHITGPQKTWIFNNPEFGTASLFANDKDLSDVNLNGLDLSNNNNISGMFGNDPQLRTVDLSNVNATKIGTVTNSNYMSGMYNNSNLFQGDKSLQDVYLSNFHAGPNIGGMFSNIPDLGKNGKGLKTFHWADSNGKNRIDLSRVKDANGLFSNDSGLYHISISDLDGLNLSTIGADPSGGVTMNLFANDKDLSDANLSGLRLDSSNDINGMFNNDPKLRSVNLNNVTAGNTSPSSSDSGMFNNDPNIRNMSFSDFKYWNYSTMFSNMNNKFSKSFESKFKRQLNKTINDTINENSHFIASTENSIFDTRPTSMTNFWENIGKMITSSVMQTLNASDTQFVGYVKSQKSEDYPNSFNDVTNAIRNDSDSGRYYGSVPATVKDIDDSDIKTMPDIPGSGLNFETVYHNNKCYFVIPYDSIKNLINDIEILRGVYTNGLGGELANEMTEIGKESAIYKIIDYATSLSNKLKNNNKKLKDDVDLIKNIDTSLKGINKSRAKYSADEKIEHDSYDYADKLNAKNSMINDRKAIGGIAESLIQDLIDYYSPGAFLFSFDPNAGPVPTTKQEVITKGVSAPDYNSNTKLYTLVKEIYDKARTLRTDGEQGPYLDPAHAAAIVGNAMCEGATPSNKDASLQFNEIGGEGGKGLFQFTGKSQPAYGYYTVTSQIKSILVNGNGKQWLQESGNPQTLAYSFAKNIERPDEKSAHYNTRMKYAQWAYNTFYLHRPN